MDLEPPERLADLPDIAGEIARGEARLWATMLTVADELHDRYVAVLHGHRLEAALASIATDLSVATQLSETQVQNRLAAAQRLRGSGPAAWTAFGQGRFDAARATEISRAFDKLARPESRALLDEHVADVAAVSTLAELRNWLRGFLAETEPELATQRADRERADRHVRVRHTDDAMAWLMAYIPSVAAEAIDRRLDRKARDHDDDGRTREQRRADLLMSWLTHHDTDHPAVSTDVAVVVPIETLAGDGDAWAISADRRWATPAAWLFDYGDPSTTVLHRLLTDPLGEVVDYTRIGYAPTEAQRMAVQLRDGTCQGPHCTRPARSCDIDHRDPWPRGATQLNNLWALCRRHHRMKSHGVLRWLLPTGQTVPASANAPP